MIKQKIYILLIIYIDITNKKVIKMLSVTNIYDKKTNLYEQIDKCMSMFECFEALAYNTNGLFIDNLKNYSKVIYKTLKSIKYSLRMYYNIYSLEYTMKFVKNEINKYGYIIGYMTIYKKELQNAKRELKKAKRVF